MAKNKKLYKVNEGKMIDGAQVLQSILMQILQL